jgi:putative Mg2+ transporter-C (MgtC) family protein
MDDNLDLILRLLLAVLAGSALGFEREVRNHAAGVRTHALVALGSALFTVAGAYGFEDILKGPNIDPARVAAQVASGIGFIGAGAIIRNGGSVRGLSTAATLWLGAALGLAAGAGLYVVVVAATVLILAVLVGLLVLERFATRVAPTSGVLEVRYVRGHGTLGPLMRALQDANVRITGFRVDDDDERALAPGARVVTVRATLRDASDAQRIAEEIGSRPEVEVVDWIPSARLDRRSPAGVAADMLLSP